MTFRGIFKTKKTKKRDVSQYFQNCKKIRYSKNNGFCGWGKLSRVGHGQTGSGPPHLARPRHILKSPGPKPDPVCEIFNPTRRRPSRGIARFQYRRSFLPGLARKILRLFPLFVRAVAPPFPRDFEACNGAPSGVFGEPLVSQNRRTEQSLAMPLYRPSDAVCACWLCSAFLIRQAYFEPRQNVTES